MLQKLKYTSVHFRNIFFLCVIIVCTLTCLLAAISLVADIDQIQKIVRVGGFVNGIPGFTAIPPIINGASELFIKLFGEVNGKHARTAIGVAELPLNSPVEVEVLVELKS